MPCPPDSLRLPNRQRRSRALISLTPLIDVVFILLIFLMLVSSFIDRKAFEISMGGAGVVPAAKSERLTFQLRLRAGGRAALDGVDVRLPDIARALGNAVGPGQEAAVLIRSGAGVDLQTVVSVMSSARRIPGLSVHLLRGASGT